MYLLLADVFIPESSSFPPHSLSSLPSWVLLQLIDLGSLVGMCIAVFGSWLLRSLLEFLMELHRGALSPGNCRGWGDFVDDKLVDKFGAVEEVDRELPDKILSSL